MADWARPVVLFEIRGTVARIADPEGTQSGLVQQPQAR
jgi:hypothetical protein